MPIIIKSDFLTKLLHINGITVWPFIIVKSNTNPALINHEKIHIAQQLEMFILPFYVQYFLDYKKGLKSNLNQPKKTIEFLAYRQIRFEQEAYENQENLDYLKTRVKYAWKKYTV